MKASLFAARLCVSSIGCGGVLVSAALQADETPAANAEAATVSAPAAVPASTPSASAPVTLNEVTVTNARPTAYGSGNASTATKTDTPLLQTPQSIQVVTRELMDDQGAITLNDVLRNVAGVLPGGYYSSYDYFRIRGFDASGYTYLDGLPVSKGAVNINRELFGLEQVEVVKGPASTLYGAGSLGGLVNLVSKRPQQDNFVTPQYSAGSYAYSEPAIDANAVLNGSRSVYARINLLYRDENTFTDFSHQKRLYAAPSLTWDIDADTKLTLLGSYQKDDNKMGFPLPAVGTVLDNPNGRISRSLYTGEPLQPDRTIEWAVNTGYEFTHRFDDTWSVRQNLRHTWDRYNWDDVLYPAGLSDDLSTLYRSPFFYSGRTDTLDVDTSAIAKFNTAWIHHQTVVGIDYYYEKDFSAGDYAVDPNNPNLPLNLFDPQYGSTIPDRPTSLTPYGDQRVRQIGFYVQDQADLTARLTATVGGRYDIAASESFGASQADHKFSPRAGLTYQLIDGLAAYGNFSHSFLPQSGTLTSGANAKPETGQNYEGGLKGDLYSGRLRFTAALYQLTRQNVLSSNPSTPNIVTQSGEQRSRGFEFETALHPLSGWELSFAYSLIAAKVTQDADASYVGQRLLNVPRHSFNAWSRYTLQNGPLRGLGVGAGGNYYTHQSGCSPSADCELPAAYGSGFDLPAYGLLNAALYYEHGPLRAQVNVSNLLNETYYAGSYDALYVQPGTPRSLLGTIGYRF